MLHLVSVRRADEKYYRVYTVPAQGGIALYEVVECEPDRTPRTLCTNLRRDDANLIATALNNHGSKQDETI